MFDNGLVEETKSLLARFGAVVPLQSLGYHQAAQFLRGELDLEQAITAAQQGHRNYAKRQMTWFRREPEVVWLEGFGDSPAVVDESAKLIDRVRQC
jgi:tRNA dimethylallyltransferase